MDIVMKQLTPERERELWDRIAGFLSSRFSDGDLYDILHQNLGMRPEEMEALGFVLRDYYEEGA